MLFFVIRFIFFFSVFLICFFILRKSQVIKKNKNTIILFVVIVILMITSTFFPIENAFMTFSSPESVYNYMNYGNVKLVIDGNKTSLVIGEKETTDIYMIIPKADNGWKLGLGIDTKIIMQKISGENIIYIYQYKNSDDYYITVFNTNGNLLNISDNCNSDFFYSGNTNDVLNKDFYTYCAYINHFNDEYCISVNDQTIKIVN